MMSKPLNPANHSSHGPETVSDQTAQKSSQKLKSQNHILPIPYAMGPYGDTATDTWKYITGLETQHKFNSEKGSLLDSCTLQEPIKVEKKLGKNSKIGKYLDSFQELQAQTVQSLQSFYDPQSTKLAVIGGDHSIAGATGAALSQHLDLSRTLLVWIDAHGDCNHPEISFSKSITGYPVAINLGECHPELQQPCQSYVNSVYYLGLRDVDREETKFLKKLQKTKDISLNSILDIREKGLNYFIQELVAKSFEYQNIWISFDVDSLDPSCLEPKETDLPIPFGLYPVEILQIIRALETTGKLNTLEITQLNSLGRDTDMTYACQRMLEAFFGLSQHRYGE